MKLQDNTVPIIKDFRNFLFMVWQHLNLPDPTPIQYDIAGYLQHGARRKIIEAFRGVGKSYITSAYVCWRLLNDPELKFLVVSASKERSDQFSTFTKRLIDEMPVLQHLKPSSKQRDSKISFDVGPTGASHSPSVKSVGITGQLTGSRANEIIADDVEVVNNSDTQTQRDKLSELVKEFDAILVPGGSVTFLGTPQTEESLYNKLRERGYCVRIWPSRIPSEKIQEAYGYNPDGDSALAPICRADGEVRHVGDPTEPLRFNEMELIEREASYGKAGFSLQFMLDTSLADAERYPLKLSNLVIMEVDPEIAPTKVAWAKEPTKVINDLPNVGFSGDRYYRPLFISEDFHEYTGRVMTIDPSGRGKDKTGYCILFMLNGQLFCPEAGALEGGYDDKTLEKLAGIAKKHKVNQIIIEANFGDGMYTTLIKPVLERIYPCTVEEVKHSTQKERRIIDTLEPVMGSHRLIIDPKVIKEDFEGEPKNPHRLFYQLTHITADRGSLLHDDALDALAMAVGYWADQMARDVERGAQTLKEELLERELQKFMDGAILVNKPQGSKKTSWFRRPIS